MKRIGVLAIFAAVFCLLLLASLSAHAEPSLWVVKGPHATVYLFGSVHVLIVKGNQAFAAQIDKLLKGDGTVFVAVGAGHLVGSDGVNAMLQKMGYSVVRL